jgi:hypothetical protein
VRSSASDYVKLSTRERFDIAQIIESLRHCSKRFIDKQTVNVKFVKWTVLVVGAEIERARYLISLRVT